MKWEIRNAIEETISWANGKARNAPFLIKIRSKTWL